MRRSGFAILFQAISQYGSAPWTMVKDVLIQDNVIKNSTAGVNLLSRSSDVGPTEGTARVAIVNNLFQDVGRDPISPEYKSTIFQLLSDLSDISIINNTAVLNGKANSIVSMDYRQETRLTIVNNVFPMSDYGLIGSGMGMARWPWRTTPPARQSPATSSPAVAAEYPRGNRFPIRDIATPLSASTRELCLELQSTRAQREIPNGSGLIVAVAWPVSSGYAVVAVRMTSPSSAGSRTASSGVTDRPAHVDKRDDQLRIGFLLDRFDIGGTELNAIKVAEGLARRSVHLTVFHFSETGPLRARYERAGVELIHVPISSLFSVSAWRAMRRVKKLADARELSLLHAHCVYANILGAGLIHLPGRRLPFLASRRWTGSLPRRSLGTINRVAQSLAGRVLVNAPSLAHQVRRESPFSMPVYVQTCFLKRTSWH